ncbi:hypothetical protein BDV93DRAFT_555922 [Ceratobasidium sp. AG-I]|nr:hypothetical protein BDV93DRAFT_555922 [Ceratobasidium sp. AG-I]
MDIGSVKSTLATTNSTTTSTPITTLTTTNTNTYNMSAKFATACTLTPAGKTTKATACLAQINAPKICVAECRSFDTSYTYPQQINLDCVLDYIPVGDWDKCHWDEEDPLGVQGVHSSAPP